jgi:hypothetical protein
MDIKKCSIPWTISEWLWMNPYQSQFQEKSEIPWSNHSLQSLISHWNEMNIGNPNYESDENKERVPFYMSILTTIPFIVRGKSVDFRNREGSSPSIPNPNPFDLITSFSHFVVDGWKFLTFLVHSTLWQRTGPNRNACILFHPKFLVATIRIEIHI